MLDSEFCIRPASPGESEELLDLKTRAFGDSSLPFTVFQCRRSASYLRELMIAGGAHAFFVLGAEARIRGYYHGQRLEPHTWFLTYVAVAEEWRGRGYGDALLDHFEEEGRRRRLTEFALDVFESNIGAVGWYARRGYAVPSRRALLRGRLANYPALAGPELEVREDVLREALEAERRNGFSKVDASCGTALLCVGLIGGDTVKLLGCDGMAVVDAARVTAGRFRSSREWIIVSGSEKEIESLPAEKREVSIRLRKQNTP